MEIDHAIISAAILLPSADSMHEILVNCLVKLAQERTDRPDMTIAVDLDVKHQTKQTSKNTYNFGCQDVDSKNSLSN